MIYDSVMITHSESFNQGNMSITKVIAPLKEVNINGKDNIENSNSKPDLKSTVYIGNLPSKTHRNDLKLFLKDEPNVSSILLRSKKIYIEGRQQILKFAFVSFSERIYIEKLNIKYQKINFLNDKPLSFENIHVAKRTKTRRSKATIKPDKKIPLSNVEKSNNTIFIRNVPYSISKEQLANFLNLDVELISMPMRKVKDLETGKIIRSQERNRGYAFATYNKLHASEKIDDKVLELNGKKLNNRKLFVAVSIARDKENESINTTIISMANS